MAQKTEERNIDLSKAEVVNNKNNRQFEIRVGDLVAKIPYNFKDDMIALFHTEVPDEWRRKGIATRLTGYALNYAKDNDLKILPYCPFIAKYIKEHPEWKPHVKRFVSGTDY
ncbi:MAG: GNAT family N-acetyltransferase [Bacteroidia bacterium]